MSKGQALPSFFVVGAQKAGTTTLHGWLSGEAGVVLPSIKETHFFSHDTRYQKGIDWYLSQFQDSKGDALAGEVDPDYMFYPEAPVRIKKHVGTSRFVFIFRNPVDRAYSHYLMSLRRSIETLPFPAALAREKERMNIADVKYMSHLSYMERANYCAQVRRFESVLSGSDFLFIRYEDLFSSGKGAATYERVCKFVGLDAPARPFDISKRSNPASEPRYRSLSRMIYGQSPLKRVIGKLIPSDALKLRIATLVEKANLTAIQNKDKDWKNSVPGWVWDAAEKEARELGKLTGLDFSGWVKKKGQ